MSPTLNASYENSYYFEENEDGEIEEVYNSKKIDTFLDIIEKTDIFKQFKTFFMYLCPLLGKNSYEGEIIAYQVINFIVKDDISKINFFDDQFLTIKCMNISRIKYKFRNIMTKYPELDISPRDPSFLIKFWTINYSNEMLLMIKKELNTEIIT